VSIHILIIVGSLVHFAATLVYIRNTLLGRTKPNRITFFLWGVVPLIAVFAGLVEGGLWALVPVFMAGFGPLLVFIFSFANTHSYWKLGPLDYWCGALACFAVILWIITKEAYVAVIFSIAADALAGYPTVLKSWKHPETETGLPYLVAFITEIVGLFALRTHAFSEYGFLVYLIILNGILIAGVYGRNPLQKLKAEFAR